MERGLYTPDHEAFRRSVRTFVDREVSPRLDDWERDQIIDRQVWSAAGAHGLIGLNIPEELGGAGPVDYRFRTVLIEELARCSATSLAAGLALQDDIVVPYIVELGTREQQERWLPPLAAGEAIGAVAMTEPGTGSDLRGIRTRATEVPGGWKLSGSKTFITNGIQSDLVIVVARTETGGGTHSLLVVERDMPGFRRGRKLAKVGLHAQDTAELFFDDVFVPQENLLGTIGGGMAQLRSLLPLERLGIAVQAVAQARVILDLTIAYTRERQAFGQAIADFQNTRFELAEMETEVLVAQSFVDRAILALNDASLDEVDAAHAKWWASDMQNRVIDRCLQLHGGYGYMTEYPVARAFQDARVQRIYGGTNEIMKHIIARSICG